MSLDVPTLEGRHVRLEPLRDDHVRGLCAAATPRGSFSLTTVPADEAGMRDYVRFAREQAARGAMLPFAVISRAHGDAVVGSTRFVLEHWGWPDGRAGRPGVDPPDAVEIGWTWLAERVQRTPVNSECKLLLLGHAFDAWRVERVHLKTDARNARSRAAIERLGARLDGVLRAHMPAADGSVRDSAWYSILRTEWPTVRERIQGFLLTRD